MYQQIDPRLDPQPAPLQNSLYQTASNAEPAVMGVFAALSTTGQQTVARYFAYVERGLPVGKAALSFEREETLHELQAHLLSLIVAFQELGDDEPKAIASAIAQFGRAQTVSGGLRRAERRSEGRRGNGLAHAVIASTVLFSASILLPTLVAFLFVPLLNAPYHLHSTSHVPASPAETLCGWPALLFLSCLAGAVSAKLSEKQGGRGLLYGALLVWGTVILTSVAFYDPSDPGSVVLHSVTRIIAANLAASWLVSAGFGFGLVRGVKALTKRRRTA